MRAITPSLAFRKAGTVTGMLEEVLASAPLTPADVPRRQRAVVRSASGPVRSLALHSVMQWHEGFLPWPLDSSSSLRYTISN
jgi:hypothetical protein